MLAALAGAEAPPLPQPATGRIERLALTSRYVEPRPVDVWLPPLYDGSKPHAVLYVNDGQFLFGALPNWGVDAIAAPLIASGALRNFIVVAPWNNGRLRLAEFYPRAVLEQLYPMDIRNGLVQEMGGLSLSDPYLRFIVDELKPAIDARYATLPARESCFIMGASLGALQSLYALCEYPRVFGGAACLSTHLIGTYQGNENFVRAVLAYLRINLPEAARVRLYMDHGDQGLDGNYAQAQAKLDTLLASLGFKPPGFVSRVFPGAGHDGPSWRARLDQPLRFLLGA